MKQYIYIVQGTWKQQLRMKFRNMRRPSVGSESASVQAGRGKVQGVHKKEVCRVQRTVQVCIMMVKRNKV